MKSIVGLKIQIPSVTTYERWKWTILDLNSLEFPMSYYMNYLLMFNGKPNKWLEQRIKLAKKKMVKELNKNLERNSKCAHLPKAS